MIDRPNNTRRRELGEFIHAHRTRLKPEMFGMDAGTRRRTPGLRREEMAQLAGVSATWYTWIEQGRDVSVSPSALTRLARVMRLTPAERNYLFELAGKRDPQASLEPELGDLPKGLVEAVAAITTPAYVLDRSWNALCWNEAAGRLFPGWLDGDADRNLLRYIFLSPAAQHLIPEWRSRAQRVAAEFRADYSHHLNAPGTQAFIDDLGRKSAFFAEAWEAHAVVEREGGERTFNHPDDGFLRYEQITFVLARHQEVKLVVLAKD